MDRQAHKYRDFGDGAQLLNERTGGLCDECEPGQKQAKTLFEE
jgi:hypothetical protein